MSSKQWYSICHGRHCNTFLPQSPLHHGTHIKHDVPLSDELAELLTPAKEANGDIDGPGGDAWTAEERRSLLLRIAKVRRARWAGVEPGHPALTAHTKLF
jgi:hypothetical protein